MQNSIGVIFPLYSIYIGSMGGGFMNDSGKKAEKLLIESVDPICLTEADAVLRIDGLMQDILKILDSDHG